MISNKTKNTLKVVGFSLLAYGLYKFAESNDATEAVKSVINAPAKAAEKVVDVTATAVDKVVDLIPMSRTEHDKNNKKSFWKW